MDRFQQYPPHPSYIAGLIDGDGCMFIRKIRDGYQSGFTLSQSRTNILQIIRYHFGGSITSCTNRNSQTTNVMDKDNVYYDKWNNRNQYNLIIRSNEYSILLDYLKHSFIIKEKQYTSLSYFYKLTNLQNKKTEKEDLYLTCYQYNHSKHGLDETLLTRLNIEYISGLFDAEGCFYICMQKYSRSYISITQQNTPDILIHISNFLGLGTIDCEQKLKIYNIAECLAFIQLVKDYLIVKYNQAEAFETFLTTNDPVIKEQMYTICNQEKHETEIFDDLNQHDKGKEGYLYIMNIKKLKNKLCKEILLKQVYKDKSIQMMGTRNVNFGKTFSTETKKKISLSIRNAKNGIQDDTILQVRNLLKEGHKNIQIQELLHLPRHTVTRIKNGKIICRSENKEDITLDSKI